MCNRDQPWVAQWEPIKVSGAVGNETESGSEEEQHGQYPSGFASGGGNT